MRTSGSEIRHTCLDGAPLAARLPLIRSSRLVPSAVASTPWEEAGAAIAGPVQGPPVSRIGQPTSTPP